jgi:hypothetical protein
MVMKGAFGQMPSTTKSLLFSTTSDFLSIDYVAQCRMLVCLLPWPPFFFLIAGREVVFENTSIQRAGYIIRDVYQKVASDLQRRDKGLVGLAADLEQQREAGPL